MGREDADGYVRIKLDIDTTEDKKIERSLKDIQDDADSAKRKLDALKQTGVAESAKSFREAKAELEKYNKELDEYISKQREATQAAGETKPTASATGNFDSISDQVEDYETRLKMLRNKGYGPGDEHFDELYIAWKNAADAEKEYLAGLEKLTDKNISKEAQKREEETRKLSEQAAEYEHLNRLRVNAKVHDKNLVKLLERQEAITARMTELKKAGVGEGYKEYDSLSLQLQDVNKSIGECREGLSKAKKSGEKTFSALNKNAKKSSGIFGAISSRLKGLALSLLIFNWISKGFNAMVAAMKEGFKNLASYSKEYNSVMSSYKSSLAELKNNLAAAFEPIVNKVVPYLTMMVNGLNTAIETLSRFMAYMSGKTTYTRAKKQVIDYKNAVDSANKSLAKFDDLNVLDSNSSDGEKTGADAFETVDIGEVPNSFKQWKEVYESYIRPTFTAIKSALEWFGDKAGTLFKGIFGDIGASAKGLWDSIINLIDTAKPYFSTFVENAKRLFTVLFEVLSGIWNSIGAPIFGFIVQILQDTIDYFAGHVGEMSDSFGEFVDKVEESWEKYLKPALEAIGTFLDEWLLPAFEAAFRDGILPMVGTVFEGICDLINGTLLPAFDGICEFLTGIFTLDFEKAWNGITKIVRAAINGIVTIIELGVNTAIDGLNGLISMWNTVAEKVEVLPTISHLSNIKLSRVQDDWSLSDAGTENRYTGVTHYTDSDTGRMYGSLGRRASRGRNGVSGNKEGTTLFYGNKDTRYRSSEPTDWKNNNNLANTVKAGSSFGQNENNSYTFTAQIDGKTLFSEFVRQSSLEKKRTGRNPLLD